MNNNNQNTEILPNEIQHANYNAPAPYMVCSKCNDYEFIDELPHMKVVDIERGLKDKYICTKCFKLLLKKNEKK